VRGRGERARRPPPALLPGRRAARRTGDGKRGDGLGRAGTLLGEAAAHDGGQDEREPVGGRAPARARGTVAAALSPLPLGRVLVPRGPRGVGRARRLLLLVALLLLCLRLLLLLLLLLVVWRPPRRLVHVCGRLLAVPGLLLLLRGLLVLPPHLLQPLKALVQPPRRAVDRLRHALLPRVAQHLRPGCVGGRRPMRRGARCAAPAPPRSRGRALAPPGAPVRDVRANEPCTPFLTRLPRLARPMRTALPTRAPPGPRPARPLEPGRPAAAPKGGRRTSSASATKSSGCAALITSMYLAGVTCGGSGGARAARGSAPPPGACAFRVPRTPAGGGLGGPRPHRPQCAARGRAPLPAAAPQPVASGLTIWPPLWMTA
jgi:hypothetical protein